MLRLKLIHVSKSGPWWLVSGNWVISCSNKGWPPNPCQAIKTINTELPSVRHERLMFNTNSLIIVFHTEILFNFSYAPDRRFMAHFERNEKSYPCHVFSMTHFTSHYKTTACNMQRVLLIIFISWDLCNQFANMVMLYYNIFVTLLSPLSSDCNYFHYREPANKSCGCPIFKWVAGWRTSNLMWPYIV